MQRMVDRGQYYTDAEADTAGTLADRRQSQIGGAVVRPDRPEMVFGKPYAREALLLGKRDLFQSLVDGRASLSAVQGLGTWIW